MASKVQEEAQVESQVEAQEENILSFDDIDAADLDVIYVPIKGMNGGVRIRPLSMIEVMQARKDATRTQGRGRKAVSTLDVIALNKSLLQASLVAPALTKEQVDVLFTKRAQLVESLLEEMNKVNGFGEEAEADAAEEFPEQRS
jgi:hypothetical protein